MKRRKAKFKAIRQRRPLSRREMIQTLAVGAGLAAVAGAARGQDVPEILDPAEAQFPQWLSWEHIDEQGNEVGAAYPVHDIAEDGSLICKFDDGFYAVDPGGHVYDNQVWYAITDWTPEGVWFSGDDGHEYLHVSDVEIVEIIEDPEPPNDVPA
jgi:hypothetical protein